MDLSYINDRLADLRSGEAHRVTPTILVFALRVAIASLVVAAVTPFVFPSAPDAAPIMGGTILAAMSTFIKFGTY